MPKVKTVNLRSAAKAIVRKLQAAHFAAYWVGGCVRDLLLQREPEDYDIATSARPEQIEALFEKTIPVGRQFGVILVVMEGRPIQVATFRAEADYRDGRRPAQVTFCDALTDARRRDFTVNGLFYDPVAQSLFDWVGGEADLQAKRLRTIGAPGDRFAEDHLRLLRAVRFAVQLGFDMEAETFAAVREHAEKIATVSAERIREELIKVFRPPHAARGLQLLQRSGLLAEVLPELQATAHCRQSPEFHPEGNVFEHLVRMLEHLPPAADPALPWAVLLHDIAKPETFSEDPATGEIHFYGHDKLGAEKAGRILERLRFPRRQIEQIQACVLHHMQFKDAPKMRKSTLRRVMLRPTFPLELELHRLDCLGSHRRLDNYEFLIQEQQALASQPQLRPPLLRGGDLIALGMPPGPGLGALLAEIREKQLQDELNSKEEALAWVRQQWSQAPRGTT